MKLERALMMVRREALKGDNGDFAAWALSQVRDRRATRRMLEAQIAATA